MNLIILVDKKHPEFAPLVFITPDHVYKEHVTRFLPEPVCKKYYITQVEGDMPTVVGDVAGIVAILKDDPAWPKKPTRKK